MVQFSSTPLDRTFAALADPTRRALLQHLASSERLSAGTLAKPFALSLPAVLKHLNVLDEAGLVARQKIGRTVYCTLRPEPLRAALGWLAFYERFWSERLDALAAFVQEDPELHTKPGHDQPADIAVFDSNQASEEPS